MTVADILRAAKAHLIERGWCQGDELAIRGSLYGYGPCCAATAMTLFLPSDAYIDAGDIFRKANGITGNIGGWNDAPERTVEDVLAAYDKAIAAADLMVTADELRAMPKPKAVVAFLRACRTFGEVGDIDGPWHDEAIVLLCGALGIQDRKALGEWERSHTTEEVFAAYDKAIATAEAAAA